MKIQIIDFKENYKQREESLLAADLIVYVCCTQKEIDELNEPVKIGYNSYHHDYNLIHFSEFFKLKSINVTFNPHVDENELLVCVNNSDSNASKADGQCEKNLSFSPIDSMKSKSESESAKILKLPGSNETFFSHLFKDNEYMKVKPEKKKIQYLFSKYVSPFPANKLLKDMDRNIKRKIKIVMVNNRALFDRGANINYDEQPCNEEYAYESNDDSLMDDETQKEHTEPLVNENATLIS